MIKKWSNQLAARKLAAFFHTLWNALDSRIFNQTILFFFKIKFQSISDSQIFFFDISHICSQYIVIWIEEVEKSKFVLFCWIASCAKNAYLHAKNAENAHLHANDMQYHAKMHVTHKRCWKYARQATNMGFAVCTFTKIMHVWVWGTSFSLRNVDLDDPEDLPVELLDSDI